MYTVYTTEIVRTTRQNQTLNGTAFFNVGHYEGAYNVHVNSTQEYYRIPSSDRLGHSTHGGSGWCSLKIDLQDHSTAVYITVFGNDLWVYLTVVMVTLLYFTTHYHIKRKVCALLYSVEQSTPVSVTSVPGLPHSRCPTLGY